MHYGSIRIFTFRMEKIVRIKFVIFLKIVLQYFKIRIVSKDNYSFNTFKYLNL